MTNNLSNIVLSAALTRDDGKRVLACAKAFALAKEHEVSVAEIGAACEDNDIRIASCQLGCFK